MELYVSPATDETVHGRMSFQRQTSTVSNASYNPGFMEDTLMQNEEPVSEEIQAPDTLEQMYNFTHFRKIWKKYKKRILIILGVAALVGFLGDFIIGLFIGETYRPFNINSNTNNQHDQSPVTSALKGSDKEKQKEDYLLISRNSPGDTCKSVGKVGHDAFDCDTSEWTITKFNNSVYLNCADKKWYTYDEVQNGRCVKRQIKRCCVLAEMKKALNETCGDPGERYVCYNKDVHEKDFEPICGKPTVNLKCKCFHVSLPVCGQDSMQECDNIDPSKDDMNTECHKKNDKNNTCICNRTDKDTVRDLTPCDSDEIQVDANP